MYTLIFLLYTHPNSIFTHVYFNIFTLYSSFTLYLLRYTIIFYSILIMNSIFTHVYFNIFTLYLSFTLYLLRYTIIFLLYTHPLSIFTQVYFIYFYSILYTHPLLYIYSGKVFTLRRSKFYIYNPDLAPDFMNSK